jgi:hypothetical protein
MRMPKKIQTFCVAFYKKQVKFCLALLPNTFPAFLLDVSLTNATPTIVAQNVLVEDFDLISYHARGQVLSELAESEEWIDGKAQIETHHQTISYYSMRVPMRPIVRGFHNCKRVK